MTALRHRTLGAWFVAGGVLVLQGAFVAALSTASHAQQPPGNNGTTKIENVDVDSVDDENNANHPHVECPFAISWYGFDEGAQSATVAFEAQMPSGTGAVAVLSGSSAPAFTASGPGDALNHTEVYELDTTGLVAQENQGYHVKVTISTTGAQGNDTKSKTFWMGPCAEPTESPSPSGSPSESPSVEPTIEPSVLPTVVESPSVSPSVQGVKVVKQLPQTGPDVVAMVALVGSALVLVGMLLVASNGRGAHQR